MIHEITRVNKLSESCIMLSEEVTRRTSLLQQQLDKLLETSAMIQKRKSDFENQISQKNSILAQQENSSEAFLSMLEAIEAENKKKAEKVSDEKQKLNDKIEFLHPILISLKALVVDQEGLNFTADEEMKRMKKESEVIENRLKKARKSRINRQRKWLEIREQCNVFKNETEERKKNIDELKNEVKKMTTSFETLKSKISLLEPKVISGRERLKQIQKEAEKFKYQIAELNKCEKDFNAKKESIQRDEYEIKNQVKSLKLKLTKKNEKMLNAQKTRSMLENQIYEILQIKNDISEKVKMLDTEINKLKIMEFELNKKLEQFNNVQYSKVEEEKLKSEIKKLEDKIEIEKEKAFDPAVHISSLNQTLRSAETYLVLLRKELESLSSSDDNINLLMHFVYLQEQVQLAEEGDFSLEYLQDWMNQLTNIAKKMN